MWCATTNFRHFVAIFSIERQRDRKKNALGKWGLHDRSGPHLADLASPFQHSGYATGHDRKQVAKIDEKTEFRVTLGLDETLAMGEELTPHPLPASPNKSSWRNPCFLSFHFQTSKCELFRPGRWIYHVLICCFSRYVILKMSQKRAR